MEAPKAFIERLRREKFFIGAAGGCANPLALDLNRAIQQLSVELYQHDFHFIKELIQNAEDNAYAEDVCPSLEFKLIKEDIANVGASATLLVLNNECGLTRADVTALCSVGDSTKVGKRNEGYVGCKGVGFKSIFMICETAMIISNGYRLRFRQTASKEAGVGYIVPEWIESPTDGAIVSASGGGKLPATVIILPIRDDKVDLVRKQLKELSPEMILFLTRIRELKVADTTKTAVDFVDFMRITRSKPMSGVKSEVCKFFEVTLTVESSACAVPEKHPYLVFQKSYPVTHPVEERKEIHEWIVTLAFPKEARVSSGHVGDVFSFLPTELKTGFPFIINADFLLTTSRETIRFDSPWNLGILDCVPAAYNISFKILVGRVQISSEITRTSKLLDPKDAYQFLPHNTIEHAYRYNSGAVENRRLRQKLCVEPQQAANLHQLEKVRAEIFKRLQKSPVVIVSMVIHNYGSQCTPGDSPPSKRIYIAANASRQVKPSFRDILNSAATSNHPAPLVVMKSSDGTRTQEGKFYVVDEYIQERYANGLVALGVPEMSMSEYETFLMDSKWLLNLPGKNYFQVLTFAAFEMKLFDSANNTARKKKFRLLKVRVEKDKVKLATFNDISGVNELFYSSFRKDSKWLSKWVDEFSEWFSPSVMPTETSKALKDASNRDALVWWMKKHASVEELTVRTFSQRLIENLVVGKINSKHATKGAILAMQFLYTAIHENFLSWSDTVDRLRSASEVIIVDHTGSPQPRLQRRAAIGNTRPRFKMRTVLLPPTRSKWSLVFSISPGYANKYIVVSDMYLDPLCSLADIVVSRSRGPFSMLEFIKQSFNAIDLPLVQVPADEHFPFLHPVTMEKSVLILQWLKEFLPTRRNKKTEIDLFLTDLKALHWLKTVYHGWQPASAIFFSDSYFEDRFTAHDLPFLDTAYSPLDLTNLDAGLVFEELEVVTDMREGCSSVAEYFSRCPAESLDQTVVNRFYAYLNEFGWSNDACRLLKVWIPASGTSKLPTWRAPVECVVSDDHDIFEDNVSHVTVLDKLYDQNLLPFFSDVLRVPKQASIDLCCEIWLKWSYRASNAFNEVTNEGGQLAIPLSLRRDKVQYVLKKIVQKNWQECSEEDWRSFQSRVGVPVAPMSNELRISIVSPSHVFIMDDVLLSTSFRRAAKGKLNFIWLLPNLSAEQLDDLVKLYTKIGVKKLSEHVKCDVHIPPKVWSTTIPPDEGLIKEGLLRSVLAYLCHAGKEHDLSVTCRQKILSQLISATEIVVSDPFEKRFRLDVKMLVSSATVKKSAFAHYDPLNRKLYHIRKDHPLVQADVTKREFNAQFATTISTGILPDRPALAQGLTMLLKLLCDSEFAMKSVTYELDAQNLVIFPEDEKLLKESMKTRIQAG